MRNILLSKFLVLAAAIEFGSRENSENLILTPKPPACRECQQPDENFDANHTRETLDDAPEATATPSCSRGRGCLVQPRRDHYDPAQTPAQADFARQPSLRLCLAAPRGSAGFRARRAARPGTPSARRLFAKRGRHRCRDGPSRPATAADAAASEPAR